MDVLRQLPECTFKRRPPPHAPRQAKWRINLHFNVTTEGQNRLNLRQACEDFANGHWIPSHYLPHEATEFVLDQFRRMVQSELELLVVEAQEGTA
jgi:hypothetical protein